MHRHCTERPSVEKSSADQSCSSPQAGANSSVSGNDANTNEAPQFHSVRNASAVMHRHCTERPSVEKSSADQSCSPPQAGASSSASGNNTNKNEAPNSRVSETQMHRHCTERPSVEKSSADQSCRPPHGGANKSVTGNHGN